jgi:Cd2+/Zn2+-exporting ATPase
MLLIRHETEHVRLVKNLRSGLEELYTDTQDDRLWSISGRSAVLTYAAQMINKADSDVFLVLPDDGLHALREEIVAAFERGVEVSSLLTGEEILEYGRVARHPPLESELQGLTGMLLVAVKNGEVLIASPSVHKDMAATITRNPDLALIARQFVWMELFTQRIYNQLGSELLDRLEPEDRRIFESLEAVISE